MAGSPGAPMSFDDLYRGYRERVVRYAARTFGEANAEDVAQEAMLRAYRAFDALDRSRPVWPWLAKVTYNAGIDLARANRTGVPTEPDAIAQLVPPLPDAPATAAVAGDDRRLLARALQRLTARDRVALRLYELDGRPVPEIAVVLGTTANAVRQRLFRARKNLAAEFEALGGQPVIGAGVGQVVAQWHPVRRALDAVRGAGQVPWHAQDNAAMAAGVALALALGGGPAVPAPAAPPARGPLTAAGPTTLAPLAPPPLDVAVPGRSLPSPAVAVPRADAVARPPDVLRELNWHDDCVVTRALRGCTSTVAANRDATTADGATVAIATVVSADRTPLHAEVVLPAGHRAGDRHPVVLAVGPYVVDGLHAYPELWRRGGLFERGFAYAQVTLRGRGGSGGCADFGGPGERADVRAAVEWAASQPWSAGRVAMWGASYDGWAALMALAEAPRGLAAVVVGSPVVDPGATLDASGVPRRNATWPRVHLADAARHRAATAGDAVACPPDAAGLVPSPAYWSERDLTGSLRGARVPALWSHGFDDAYAPAAPSLAAFAALGGPKRGFFGRFGHGFLLDDPMQDRWFTEAIDWVDRYAGGRAEPVPTGVLAESGGGTATGQAWREAGAWPPAVAPARMPLLPGAYRDVPGNCADATCPSLVTANCTDVAGRRAQCGRGSWTFTQPLPAGARLAGDVVVTVRRAGRATGAVVLLYDVDPAGRATLVARGAAAAAGPRVVVRVTAVDWRLPAGHRLGVLVSADESDWFAPAHSGDDVLVDGGTAVLPVVVEPASGWFARAPSGLAPFPLPREVDVASRTVHVALPRDRATR